MTVKYLTRSASARGNYQPGDVVNLPDDLAKLLIKAGSVEKIETKSEPQKQKPKKETVEKKAITEPEETATMPPPKRRRSTNK